MITTRFFAVFFAFVLFQTCSSASPGLSLENYGQISQQFGFPFPFPLPKFNFSDVSKECHDTVTYLSRTALAKKYIDAIGKPQSGLLLGNTGWLGSYSECTKTIPEAHYCLAYLNIIKELPVRWGVCAPKQCSEEDVTKGLQDVFTGINNYFKIEVGLSPQKGLGLPPDGKAVYCSKKSEYTTGVILTLTLCGLILFLCLMGTILDVAISFMKKPSPSVNKSDGFLPIRDTSLAAGAKASDSFARNDQGSETTHLLNPSSEVIRLESSPQRKDEPNVVVQFFLCFSLIKNTSRIMDTNVPASAITSINGMRVLSMWWVILGHVYFLQVQRISSVIISNFPLMLQIIRRFTFEAVVNGTVSVDSFFFLRLTPAYMFVLLFLDKLSGFLGEGPFWYLEQAENPCGKYWWTNLLYINNFYPTAQDESCFRWAWYLANDMQFYIIAPAILFVAYRFRLRGLFVFVGVLLSISFITTAVIIAHYDIPVVGLSKAGREAGKRGVDSESLIYVKPYCRIAPYLVGMVLGYLLLHSKGWRLPTKVHMYLFNMTGWCVAIVLALSTVYGTYKPMRQNNPEPFSRAENITYGTFARFAWSLALAWVIFACHSGLGGLVNRILSARFWIPLSRLTYCAYLVHLTVMWWLLLSYETVQAYSDVHTAFCFVGFLGMSYAVAFIVSVCVEFPMMQLEKIIFRSDR